MTDNGSNPEPEIGKRRSRSALGCAVVLVLVVGASLASWWVITERAQQAQSERADNEFAPVLDKLRAPAEELQETDAAASPTATTSKQSYDIDRTMQVLHALDSALAGNDGAASLLPTP